MILERIEVAAEVTIDNTDIVGDVWATQMNFGGSALYYRLLLDDIEFDPGTKFEIKLIDPNNGQSVVIESDFLIGRQKFTTEFLFTDPVLIVISTQQPIKKLRLVIDSRLVPLDELTPLGPVYDFEPVTAAIPPQPFQDATQGVAKLMFGSGASCSGFLVSPTTVITSYHCLKFSTDFAQTSAAKIPACGDVAIAFDFRSIGPLRKSQLAKCVSVLPFSSKESDIAGLLIDRQMSQKRILALAHHLPNSEESIHLLHHPVGLPMKYEACDKHKKHANGDRYWAHNCTTASGSSGGPLLGSGGAVVAVHARGSFPKDWTVAKIEEFLASGNERPNRAVPIMGVKIATDD